MTTITINTYNELFNYSQSNPNLLIVMDFYAKWCSPCKSIKPFFKYLEENYPNVLFIEIDIENESTMSITETFEIAKVPTFIYFKNGSICQTIIGTNKDNIENTINEFL